MPVTPEYTYSSPYRVGGLRFLTDLLSGPSNNVCVLDVDCGVVDGAPPGNVDVGVDVTVWCGTSWLLFSI